MGLKKRGGISVYIIIGVTLLLISVLIFSLYDKGDQFKKDVIPASARDHPVIFFIDECIKDTTFNGIKQLSLQAGHLNPLPDSSNPIRSSGVYLTDIFIPYWYYIEGNQIKSRMPVLHGRENSIQSQLNEYVKKNLNYCLNNYEVFKNQYEVEEGELRTDVLIRETDVQINVLYPVKIKSLSDGSVRQENNFNTRLNVPLKEIYTFAKQIIELQHEMNLFEQHTLNVISLYSGLDEPLPPMSDVTIGSNELRYWTRYSVEEVIKNDVLDFIRLIQIINAKNFNPIVYADESAVNEIMQGLYASMAFKVDDKLYENIEANFMYPSTDIFLEIGGKELIMPENRFPLRNMITDMLRIIIYDYSFEYDLTFPVVASLKMNDAYKGEDLYFRFGIQANIRNNIPLNYEFDFDDITSEFIFGFEDKETFVYDPVFIKTVDNFTELLIDDVNIFYSCGRETFIEKTNFGYIYEFFPFCMFGGKIIATHPDYATVVHPYDNQDDSEKEFLFNMKPLKQVDVEIRKIELKYIDFFTQPLSPLYSRDNMIYENSKPLGENERVLITLSKIKEFDEELDIPFISFLEITTIDQIDYIENIKVQVFEKFENGEITLEERDEILIELEQISFDQIEMEQVFELVPGNYSYSAYLFYEGNITIPEKVTTFCPSIEVMGICGSERETITLPEMKFNSLPVGGANANITISNDLYTSDKIIFYVFVDEVPKTWDEFENMKSPEDFFEYNYLLKPYLIQNADD